MTTAASIFSVASLLHDLGLFRLRALGEPTSHIDQSLMCVDWVVPAQWRDEVRALVQAHHAPNTANAQRLRLADWLSLGEDDGEIQDKAAALSLESIFCSLQVKDTPTPAPQYWRLNPLEATADSVMPTPTQATQTEYEQLWQAFAAEAELLRQAHEGAGNLPVFAESLQLLLQRFTTAVPAASKAVSLYDHSRTTAALAVALMGLSDAEINVLSKSDLKSAPQPVALLIGGDLSGIQDFIYTITSKGAASGLRGRSFYLQLLTEAAMRFVLRELGLPTTSVLYSGGGHFYVLARATDAARLPDLQRRISEVMLRHHFGDLHLMLAQVPVQASDFFEGRMGACWGKLSEALQTTKRTRFSELGNDLHAKLFVPQGRGGSEDQLCSVCGQEHPRTLPDDDNLNIRKCPQCKSYEDLGEDLRNATALVLDFCAPIPASENRDACNAVLAELGLRVAFEAKPTQRIVFGVNKLDGATGLWQTVLALCDDAVRELRPVLRRAVGRRFITNVAPVLTPEEVDYWSAQSVELSRVNRVKPFDVMECESNGIQRLGVLLMDVDNLGALFRTGLGQTANLARIVHLSFAINFFFEGWVAQIAEKISKERAQESKDRPKSSGCLYSIYAGGDDLFFVGAWDAVMELAQCVREDLGQYAAQHAGIHASGGMVLTSGKYPLFKAAQDVKAAEQAAKQLIGKDAFCFLGQALKWGLMGYANAQPSGSSAAAARTLLRNLCAQTGNKSLIHTLAQLYAQYAEVNEARAARGEGKQLFGPWHYLAAYQFGRMKQRHRHLEKEIEEARNALMAHDFQGIEWIGLAARWAELEERNN